MKYQSSKIALGIVLILISLFTVKDISFANSEAIGISSVPIGLIVGGIYLIYRGSRNTKKDSTNL